MIWGWFWSAIGLKFSRSSGVVFRIDSQSHFAKVVRLDDWCEG